MKEGVVKQKITHDYILDLYEQCRKLKSKKKKSEMLKEIKKLTNRIGDYVIKVQDDS
jgi:hypothetical protein